MTVIDEYFQKVEKEPLEIFESSKKLILQTQGMVAVL